jgi:dihydrofolate synthase/folylpolyglutamate synthase
VFDLPKYGRGVCLARLTRLLTELGIDRDRLQRNSVVITGSNGKGSTAAFCASIGRAAGLRTGLFTSPHLYRFNERFRIDGEPIDDAQLSAMMTRVGEAIKTVSRDLTDESFGAFEAQFALACLYFQEMECAFAVFEAGIGGRYDPVRLVNAALTCVTSVDYEHTALLGNSLEFIASDKSDACCAGGTIVYGENCRPLRAHLEAYNRSRNVSGLFVRDGIAIAREVIAGNRPRFELRYGAHHLSVLEIGLAGAFQINNAAIAATLFLLWAERTQAANASALEAAIRTGLAETRWPGRLEMIRQHPLTIIDVGHTPDGITQALRGLADSYGAQDWILVTGVSHDKKADEIVRLLAARFDTIICTAAHHKGAPAEAIAAAARAANPTADVRVAAAIEDAVALSTEIAARERRRIFVAGGLFLAIEYAAIVKGQSPADLHFF